MIYDMTAYLIAEAKEEKRKREIEKANEKLPIFIDLLEKELEETLETINRFKTGKKHKDAIRQYGIAHNLIGSYNAYMEAGFVGSIDRLAISQYGYGNVQLEQPVEVHDDRAQDSAHSNPYK